MDRPALTVVDTFHGHAREACVVTVPDDSGHDHPGTWSGDMRARLLDEATGDWWFELTYTTGASENRIDTFSVQWVRRMDLNDFDGLIPKRHLRPVRQRPGDNSSAS